MRKNFEQSQQGIIEGDNNIDIAKARLKELDIPDGVFPEALFQDEEMLNFLIERLPSIKPLIVAGSLTGHGEVRNELRGVQDNTGASKILFEAMDLAICLKKPELARRVAVVAGFDIENVKNDIWNQFMMTRIHSLGWEYFYRVGEEFGIDEGKINDTLLRSIESEIPSGKKEVVENFKLFKKHSPPDQSIPETIAAGAVKGAVNLLKKKNFEEAEELASTFSLSIDQKVESGREAIIELISDKKYADAIVVGDHESLGEDFLCENFSQYYLNLAKSLSWTEMQKLQSEYGKYITRVDEHQRNQVLTKGLIEKMNGRDPKMWLLSEANKPQVASLPDSIFQNTTIQAQSCKVYTALLLKFDKDAGAIIELLRTPPQLVEKYLHKVVLAYFGNKNLERTHLESIVAIIQAHPFLRKIIDNPEQQRQVFESLKLLISARTNVAKYIGLLSQELQSQLLFSEMEQAIRDDNQREFARVSDITGLFENIGEDRRKWTDLRACTKAGFSLYEISRYPFLVSSIINQQ